MAVSCTKCGGAHAHFYCQATPAKIAAFERSKRETSDRLAESIDAESREAKLGAGTGKTTMAKDQRISGLNPEPIIHPKNKGGRPRIHPDRKAYKADFERKRRAKLKEAKSK